LLHAFETLFWWSTGLEQSADHVSELTSAVSSQTRRSIAAAKGLDVSKATNLHAESLNTVGVRPSLNTNDRAR